MSFRDLAKRVRAAATQHGIKASMSHLNDAIAVACYGKRYTSVLAAEGAGKLPAIPDIPPHISKAARQFNIPAHAFGLALREGVGKNSPKTTNVVGRAVDWLFDQHHSELDPLTLDELLGLAERQVTQLALAHPSLGVQMKMAYADLVIADATVTVDGTLRRAIDSLRAGYFTSLPQEERKYLEALATTPLRLYLVDSVQPGYCMRLRELGRGTERFVTVLERTGSNPNMQGQAIATRIVPVDDHFEMAGGTLAFTFTAMTSVIQRIRQAHSDIEVSREIRKAWFSQFEEQPHPQFVTAYEGDPMRLIVDTYRCRDLKLLASNLRNAGLRGSVEQGWSVIATGSDGLDRPMCSVQVTDHEKGIVTAYYESENRAERYRKKVEHVAGDLIEHIRRTSEDPFEAAMNVPKEEARRARKEMTALLTPEVLTEIFETTYAGWANKPIPILDNLTPTQMIALPGGEARVRELLAIYEGNQLSSAEHEQHEPARFEFLYESVGLKPTEEKPLDQYERVIRSEHFEVNEAWVVFRMFDEPVRTTSGDVDMLALMDASSTIILNTHPILNSNFDIGPLAAKQFLSSLKVMSPPRPAQELLLPATLSTSELEAEARRLGMKIRHIHEDDLLAIVGDAKASFAVHMKDVISGRSTASPVA